MKTRLRHGLPGPLMDPDVGFSLVLPELDGEVRQAALAMSRQRDRMTAPLKSRQVDVVALSSRSAAVDMDRDDGAVLARSAGDVDVVDVRVVVVALRAEQYGVPALIGEFEHVEVPFDPVSPAPAGEVISNPRPRAE